MAIVRVTNVIILAVSVGCITPSHFAAASGGDQPSATSAEVFLSNVRQTLQINTLKSPSSLCKNFNLQCKPAETWTGKFNRTPSISTDIAATGGPLSGIERAFFRATSARSGQLIDRVFDIDLAMEKLCVSEADVDGGFTTEVSHDVFAHPDYPQTLHTVTNISQGRGLSLVFRFSGHNPCASKVQFIEETPLLSRENRP